MTETTTPRGPVFLFGFTRGGTNIAMNLLLSHPGICGVRGELQEVFKGRHIRDEAERLRRRRDYERICEREGHKVFSLRRVNAPPGWSAATRRDVRTILEAEPLLARREAENRFRAPGVEYTDDEIRRARIACKAPDGLAFLSDELSCTFSGGVRFIALVRNGYAVCEGKLRRGQDLVEAAREYHAVCQRMLADAARFAGYGIVRFEDLLSRPHEILVRLLAYGGEDAAAVETVRLQNKGVVRPDGTRVHVTDAPDRKVLWYPRSGFEAHFVTEVDATQAARLDRNQRAVVEQYAGASLEQLGYLQQG